MHRVVQNYVITKGWTIVDGPLLRDGFARFRISDGFGQTRTLLLDGDELSTQASTGVLSSGIKIKIDSELSIEGGARRSERAHG